MDDSLVETRVDLLFGGRLRLEQPCRGHRAGTDAVLLAAAADVRAGDDFLDLGAGVGTVGLALALREPGVTGRLVERDEATAVLAARNVAANGLNTRLAVVTADLFDSAACRQAALIATADLVVTNPPFHTARTVRRSDNPNRAQAHVLGDERGESGHRDWVRAACALLKPNGRLLIIQRAEHLPELLAGMAGRLGGIRVLPVQARDGEPAIRILVGGRRGSREPLVILPPIVLHQADGAFTPQAERLHAGVATLRFWPPARPRQTKAGPEGPADLNIRSAQ